jgi:predicted  nucleic acid-binding Zn-ribbon protein
LRPIEAGLPKPAGRAILEGVMKMKIGVVILAAVCVGLLIALIVTIKSADRQQAESASAILDLSNQLDKASVRMNDLSQTNLRLNDDLSTNRETMLEFSNKLNEAADTLSGTRASLQSAQDQITNLNSRIADLETQNQALDQRAAELTNTIAHLSAQISDTQQKLADSRTNNAFLTRELKRQMDEKAELERKFNTLDVVRTQVKKLRDDLMTARRLQWTREGTDPATQMKGAQLLMQRPAPASASQPPPHYDLNVEVGSDGSVHLIPQTTNSAATTTNPPPQ